MDFLTKIALLKIAAKIPPKQPAGWGPGHKKRDINPWHAAAMLGQDPADYNSVAYSPVTDAHVAYLDEHFPDVLPAEHPKTRFSVKVPGFTRREVKPKPVTSLVSRAKARAVTPQEYFETLNNITRDMWKPKTHFPDPAKDVHNATRDEVARIKDKDEEVYAGLKKEWEDHERAQDEYNSRGMLGRLLSLGGTLF